MTTLKYEDGFDYLNHRQKQLQKEKDDFAVKFSEWIESLRSSEIDTIDYDLYLRYNTEELLEIYKKEKGL